MYTYPMNLWINRPRNQLILFFLLSFILAWGTWIPAFLLPQFPKQLSLIGLFAPAISALIVTALRQGKKGVTALLGRYKIWRFGIQWYFLAIFLLPFIYLLAIFINALFFRYSLHDVLVGSPLYFIFAAFVWLMVINSGEEIGWRGFALPIMLKSMKNPVWGKCGSRYHMGVVAFANISYSWTIGVPLSIVSYFNYWINLHIHILVYQNEWKPTSCGTTPCGDRYWTPYFPDCQFYVFSLVHSGYISYPYCNTSRASLKRASAASTTRVVEVTLSRGFAKHESPPFFLEDSIPVLFLRGPCFDLEKP